MMGISEAKTKLLIYQTHIEEDKVKLAEMVRRHEEGEYIFPESLHGEPAQQLEDYLSCLKEAIFEIDVLRSQIVSKLRELE